MEKEAESLLREALAPCGSDRAAIAGALLESIEPSSESDVEEAWRHEVAVRIQALAAGEIQTVPWEEVRDRLWARLSETPSD